MINRTVARRYAAALYEAAAQEGVVDPVERHLGAISAVVKERVDLRRLVENRRLPADRRKEVLEQAAGTDCPRLLVNLLRLLVDKQRETYLGDIYTEYRRAALAAKNMAEAEVTTAVELSQDSMERIRTRLEELTGKKIEIVPRVDPDAVGGLVVRIGDRRLDASLRRRLEELREAIAGGRDRDQEGVLVR